MVDSYRILRDHDLARSGLHAAKTRKSLGIEDIIPHTQTEAITGIEDAVSYEIPYFDVRGKSLKYSRYKLIGIGKEELNIKYYQDEKTIPHLYLPRLLNWKKISQDVEQRIYITEGEKKAACACLFDLPCISVEPHRRHADPGCR